MDDLFGFIAATAVGIMEPLIRRLLSAIRWRRQQGPHGQEEDD